MIASSVLGFVFWLLASNFYNASTIGIASSILSTEQFLSFTAILGFGLGILRFLQEEEDPGGLVNTFLVLVTLCAVVLGALFVLYGVYLSKNLTSAFIGFFPKILIIVLLVMLTTNLIVNAVFIAMRGAKFLLFSSMIMNIGRLIFLLSFRSFGLLGIIGAMSLGFLISNLMGIKFFLPQVIKDYNFRLQLNLNKIKKMFFYSFGNYMADIFKQMSRTISIPMSVEILGEAQGAYAYMVWLLATIIFSPGVAISQSFLVEGVHSPGAVRKLILRSAAVSVSVTLIIASACYVGSDFVLRFFGEGYVSEANQLFRLMILSSPLVVLNNVFIAYLQLRKIISLIILSAILQAAAALSVPYFLLEMFGINSIAYGWLAANLILSAFFFVLVYNKKIPSGILSN
jgi:O-antigen/teichoic acid export membrane protein